MVARALRIAVCAERWQVERERNLRKRERVFASVASQRVQDERTVIMATHNMETRQQQAERKWLWKNRNPSARINHNAANILYSALKRGTPGRNRNGRWHHYFMFSFDEVRRHIEAQWKWGMNWSNYGHWHIDHIIPKSRFHVQVVGDGEYNRCWSLENLRPLWARDNYRPIRATG